MPATALAYSLAQPKEYSATASLLFRDPGFDQKLFGSNFFQPQADPTREAATNVKLVSLEVVAARTARVLGRGFNGPQISKQVQANAEGQANVVGVTATDRGRPQAARLANAFARQYIAFRREADRAKIRQAERLVSRQIRALPPDERTGARGRSLRSRAEELQILGSLQTGNAELVQPALLPASPSSPHPRRSAVIGLVLGLLIGAGAAVLLERLDRRLKDPEEVEEAFERPVLGAIPESRTLDRTGGRAGRRGPSGHEIEAFLLLRANLRYFNIGREIRSVLITSAAPGDGKSTIALNLAVAAATTGARVLLIEADLRNPTLAGALGTAAPPHGLSDVLAGHITAEEAMEQMEVETGPAGRAAKVNVLFCGPLPPNPTDLIESERMREVIRAAEADFELVIVDTPPTSIVSDAIPLVNEVSGVLVVSRLRKSTRDSAIRLRNQLHHLGAPVLGVVVNAARSGRGSYGYYRYYGERPPADGNGRAPEAVGVRDRS